MASGRRSGLSCRWRCASGWRPFPRRRFLTANRSNRRKRDCNDDQVGYNAGKQVKGCKFHALVHSEGLPMRLIVYSAAIQDRDGAGLILDKIRRLPLARTDLGRWRLQRLAGRSCGGKDAAAAHVDRQAERRHKSLRRSAAPQGGQAHLLLVRRKPASRQGFREPCRNPRHLRDPLLHPACARAACQGIDRQLSKPRFASHDGEGLQIEW
jgi:hypothetical protein